MGVTIGDTLLIYSASKTLAMYSLETISTEKDDFQKAVLNVRAFKPLYVKINYGCNLHK